MNQLHDELHKLSDSINDVKCVIEVSDKLLHAMYKRHVTLLCNSEDKIRKIQKNIDSLILKYPVDNIDVHATNHGEWP